MIHMKHAFRIHDNSNLCGIIHSQSSFTDAPPAAASWIAAVPDATTVNAPIKTRAATVLAWATTTGCISMIQAQDRALRHDVH